MSYIAAAPYEHDAAGSPDSQSFSSTYPNRPIKPLPKRRLRERLTVEEAESIEYPPSSQVRSIFYPYSTENAEEDYRRDIATSHSDVKSGSLVRRFVGAGTDGSNGIRPDDDKDAQARGATVSRSPPGLLNRNGTRQIPKHIQSRNSAVPPPASVDSSADSYDSLENTNNKKKRKIPTAGDSSGHLTGPHSLGDGGTIAVSACQSSTNHVHGGGSTSLSSSNSPLSGNKGISGAGRGSFGRVRNGRSPLRSLSNANNWTDRTSKNRPASHWTTPSSKFTPRVSAPA